MGWLSTALGTINEVGSGIGSALESIGLGKFAGADYAAGSQMSAAAKEEAAKLAQISADAGQRLQAIDAQLQRRSGGGLLLVGALGVGAVALYAVTRK